MALPEPVCAWPRPHPAPWQALQVGNQALQGFFALWQHWLASDPAQRPARLSVVCLLTALPAEGPDLARLHTFPAEAIALLTAQWPTAAPQGVHRLRLGHVDLTLCVGAVRASLLAQGFEADAVAVDARHSGSDWDLHTVKALARCCRLGAAVQMAVAIAEARAMAGLLRQAGVVVDSDAPADRVGGHYRPPWTPRRRTAFACRQADQVAGRQAAVVGGGLAGASVAARLASRGWQVEVLDAAEQPASGASGVPVGLFAPHWSPDDSPLSHLSRAGAQALLHQVRALLREGEDWAPTGVLEHRGSAGPLPEPPKGWHGAQPAGATLLQAAHWPAATPALWHGQAGWVKPVRLVEALLATPGVAWRGQCRVARLAPTEGRWQLQGVDGQLLHGADLVVVTAGHASAALLNLPLPLRPVRGQVSWGNHGPGDAAALAPFPVNGAGSLVPWVPTPAGPTWYLGATFERDPTGTAVTPADHVANWQRLATLAPHWRPGAGPAGLQGWAGVRCATPDRLPLLGPLPQPAEAGAGLAPWVCTGLGARGLCWALLCAELLVARLHGEPLPVARQWAEALDPGRFGRAH